MGSLWHAPVQPATYGIKSGATSDVPQHLVQHLVQSSDLFRTDAVCRHAVCGGTLSFLLSLLLSLILCILRGITSSLSSVASHGLTMQIVKCHVSKMGNMSHLIRCTHFHCTFQSVCGKKKPTSMSVHTPILPTWRRDSYYVATGHGPYHWTYIWVNVLRMALSVLQRSLGLTPL